jgi:hypothetical protein
VRGGRRVGESGSKTPLAITPARTLHATSPLRFGFAPSSAHSHGQSPRMNESLGCDPAVATNRSRSFSIWIAVASLHWATRPCSKRTESATPPRQLTPATEPNAGSGSGKARPLRECSHALRGDRPCAPTRYSLSHRVAPNHAVLEMGTAPNSNAEHTTRASMDGSGVNRAAGRCGFREARALARTHERHRRQAHHRRPLREGRIRCLRSGSHLATLRPQYFYSSILVCLSRSSRFLSTETSPPR